MNHICTENRRFEKKLEEVDSCLPVNVLEATEDLIKEVANMFVRNRLTSEQLVQVSFHEFLKMVKVGNQGRYYLDNIQMSHFIENSRSDDIVDGNNVFMVEMQQDFDFTKRSLAVCMVVKR